MASLRNPRRRRTDSREAVQLRDDVLAIVAHDLRSPIATILMATELLRGKEAGPDSSRCLDMIVSAATQADALIRDLVDVARIESGRFSVNPMRQRLASILTVATEGFAQQAARAHLTLTCDVADAAGLSVLVDYPRFAQLLSNLIDNAIKFTPHGGDVCVSASAEVGFVRISVKDSGIGISPEETAHIFERFWQASRHHRAGAGLGLAIAKGIVEAHGGQIGVNSVEGAGSTFYFTVPLAPPDSCPQVAF